MEELGLAVENTVVRLAFGEAAFELGPAEIVRRSTRGSSQASSPKSGTSRAAPKTRTSVAVTARLAVSWSGASGAEDCHASMTSDARARGQASVKRVAAGEGTAANTSEVTTPN